MIVTVTLNPCIDQTLTVASFARGGMNRVVNARRDAAGKGVNVSAALAGLGVPSLCMGVNYNENGRLIDDRLNALGVRFDFARAEGAVRTNIKLYEQDTGTMTEINQPGAYVPPEVIEELIVKIKNASAELIILSGSRPQGVAEDIYARIIAETGAPAIVDTEGAALLACLSGGQRKPYLIKPNLFELESAYHVTLKNITGIASFARRLTVDGPERVCVSMGKEGAVLASQSGAYYAKALEIPVRGVQGAGDSMVAGMAMAMTRHAPDNELLRYAVAAASASVIREGTQLCEREGFEAMLQRVEIEDITSLT